MARKEPVYKVILKEIFLSHYQTGMMEVGFDRTEIDDVSKKLSVKLPKNFGDLVYSFRYRGSLPESILETAPEDRAWIILPAGRSKYCFKLTALKEIKPNTMLSETKIPDATPGIVTKYAIGDEQGLLAKVRYNRLIDIFTGVTCYSLQNHLRTFVPDMGQVETDEMYVGLDQRGAQYVFPVQAKGGKDKLGVVQIYQDFGVGIHKFPSLICRPIACQFANDDLIVLFEFEKNGDDISISLEKHYRLVPPADVSIEDLNNYRKRKLDFFDKKG